VRPCLAELAQFFQAGTGWHPVSVLIALAGLPGSGKSAVAGDLSRALHCAVLSVDPAEAAMWRAGVSKSEPTGLAAYMVVEALAAEQIALGHDVIVDAVNAVEPARAQWRALAGRLDVDLRFIEVQCSDPDVHRRRLEARRRGIAGFYEPSWNDVQRRREEFAAWIDDRLALDSMDSRQDNLVTALKYLDRLPDEGWPQR
jgi:predicted kinase